MVQTSLLDLFQACNQAFLVGSKSSMVTQMKCLTFGGYIGRLWTDYSYSRSLIHALNEIFARSSVAPRMVYALLITCISAYDIITLSR